MYKISLVAMRISSKNKFTVSWNTLIRYLIALCIANLARYYYYYSPVSIIKHNDNNNNNSQAKKKRRGAVFVFLHSCDFQTIKLRKK